MSENATTTINVPLKGILFMKEEVKLPPTRDEQGNVKDRTMCVLQIANEEGVTRVTDFSNIHRVLEVDTPVRVIYAETVDESGDYPRTHRNLVAAVPELA